MMDVFRLKPTNPIHPCRHLVYGGSLMLSTIVFTKLLLLSFSLVRKT